MWLFRVPSPVAVLMISSPPSESRLQWRTGWPPYVPIPAFPSRQEQELTRVSITRKPPSTARARTRERTGVGDPTPESDKPPTLKKGDNGSWTELDR